MKIVKITGASGSGKSYALDAIQEAKHLSGVKTASFNSSHNLGAIVSISFRRGAKAIFVDECSRDVFDGLADFDDPGLEDCVAFVAMKDDESMRDVAVAGSLLQEACHGASLAAHWWTDMATGADLREHCYVGTRLGKALVAEKLALIHSEVSEAMEGHRKALMDDKLPRRPAIEVELADAVIRIADLAGALNLDLGGAIAEKMAFNRQRPDHKPEARQAAGGKAY